MGPTKVIADFCTGLNYSGLPLEAVDRVKYLALDLFGAAARGAREDVAGVVRRFIREMDSRESGVVLIGTGDRAPVHYAALANGVSAHSLEIDDVSNESSSHPGSVIFPAALAVSELAGAGGRGFIEGVIAGYEVMIRLGRALNPAGHYARGFHPTGTCGVFGAAAAAAKILKLDAAQTLSALGIAGSQASGSMEFLTAGASTKPFHAGWATHNGIVAAILAKNGLTGPATIFEGRFGFLHGYSDSPDPDKLLYGLGEGLEIMRVSIKPHACCRYKQGPIDGIIRLMREHNLEADMIEGVVLGILKPGFPIVVEPEEQKYNPQTVSDARFSMPFGAALAMLYGRASLDEYSAANLESPQIKGLMKRVRCISDPELDKLYPRKWPATVEIVTKDGREFTVRVDYPKGDPENPLSWDELIEKFSSLTAPVFPEKRRKEIVSQVRSLEAVSDIAELTGQLIL